MKIVLVTDIVSRYAGGMFDAVRRMAQEVHRAGATVEVFGIEDSSGAEDLSLWDPCRARLLRCRGPRTFGFSPELTSAMKAENPAVIDVHGLWTFTSIAVRRASTSLNCPYVVHPHGMLDPWALRHSGWKKKLAAIVYERSHLENAACLRALNRSESDSMRALGLTNPICIIPFGIDLPEGFPTAADTAMTPDDPNAPTLVNQIVSSGQRLLLFLGRIHPKKGLVNLLHAWALVKGRGHAAMSEGWVLGIAGWGQGGHQDELERLVCDLDLGGSVAFLGPQFGSAKDAYLRRCDAFILPSLSEGLPVSVLEAWSYSKPVVMTAACNMPEGFSAGSAIEIEPSPSGVAKGILSLFEMTITQRAQMGARGRTLVQDKFSWPRAAAQMRNVYDWLVTGGSPPDCVEFAP
jgi:glycosyltransferase involved in cell wall biosynthesis